MHKHSYHQQPKVRLNGKTSNTNRYKIIYSKLRRSRKNQRNKTYYKILKLHFYLLNVLWVLVKKEKNKMKKPHCVQKKKNTDKQRISIMILINCLNNQFCSMSNNSSLKFVIMQYAVTFMGFSAIPPLVIFTKQLTVSQLNYLTGCLSVHLVFQSVIFCIIYLLCV